MSNLDAVIFGKKKFSDMLQEIYNNQKKKREIIYEYKVKRVELNLCKSTHYRG
jgi:predicted CopG family antitoxin